MIDFQRQVAWRRKTNLFRQVEFVPRPSRVCINPFRQVQTVPRPSRF